MVRQALNQLRGRFFLYCERKSHHLNQLKQCPGKTDTVRVHIGLYGGLSYHSTHSVMSQKYPIDLLNDSVWSLGAQDATLDPLVGFDFIDHWLHLPAFM